MEIRDYLRVLRKRAWLVIVAGLLCPAAALVASLATAPVYQGSAKLFVAAKTEPGSGIGTVYEGTLLSQQLVKSFASVLESRAVAEAALGLDPQPLTARQLQAKVHAEPVTDTLLIDLSVEDTDPSRAKRLTNGVARAFIDSVPRLQGGSAVRVSLVEPALTPSEPVRPRTRLNIALGLLLGLIIGVGLAFLREALDRSIKTPEELETATGAPVVGTVPSFKASKDPIPVADKPRTAAAESFRKLRTNFAFLGVDRLGLCCAITSPLPAEGKSTVTANLAIALAQAGQRVAVIDADLRKPSIHKLFGLNQRIGTTTILLDHADVHDAIQHLDRDLPDVLVAGQLPPNPSALLGSRRMQELVGELRAAYEVILIDCPPILPVTDPMVVSQFTDGILLVSRAGSTTRDQAQAAKDTCVKAGAKILGSVLNASSVMEGSQPAYYAYYGEGGGKAADARVAAGLNAVAGNGAGHRSVEADRAVRHRRARSGVR
jgi:capsular exopolysaccharide synthesis family protein